MYIYIPSVAENPDPTKKIVVKDFMFMPTPLTVKAGSTVIWRTWTMNRTRWSRHRAVPFRCHGYERELLVQVRRAGTYHFTCSIHPRMVGYDRGAVNQMRGPWGLSANVSAVYVYRLRGEDPLQLTASESFAFGERPNVILKLPMEALSATARGALPADQIGPFELYAEAMTLLGHLSASGVSVTT